MSLIGFKAENHPQQTDKRGAKDSVDDRRTPAYYWDALDELLGFTLDAAAVEENSKTEKWCRDGLSESWAGERVWCNPPYSDLKSWVQKAWDEFQKADGPELVAMLLPANRCEQVWWQELVEPQRESLSFRVRFLKGRMRFGRPGWVAPEKGDRPPFGVCLLLWARPSVGEKAIQKALQLDGTPPKV